MAYGIISYNVLENKGKLEKYVQEQLNTVSDAERAIYGDLSPWQACDLIKVLYKHYSDEYGTKHVTSLAIEAIEKFTLHDSLNNDAFLTFTIELRYTTEGIVLKLYGLVRSHADNEYCITERGTKIYEDKFK